MPWASGGPHADVDSHHLSTSTGITTSPTGPTGPSTTAANTATEPSTKPARPGPVELTNKHLEQGLLAGLMPTLESSPEAGNSPSMGKSASMPPPAQRVMHDDDDDDDDDDGGMHDVAVLVADEEDEEAVGALRRRTLRSDTEVSISLSNNASEGGDSKRGRKRPRPGSNAPADVSTVASSAGAAAATSAGAPASSAIGFGHDVPGRGERSQASVFHLAGGAEGAGNGGHSGEGRAGLPSAIDTSAHGRPRVRLDSAGDGEDVDVYSRGRLGSVLLDPATSTGIIQHSLAAGSPMAGPRMRSESDLIMEAHSSWDDHAGWESDVFGRSRSDTMMTFNQAVAGHAAQGLSIDTQPPLPPPDSRGRLDSMDNLIETDQRIGRFHSEARRAGRLAPAAPLRISDALRESVMHGESASRPHAASMDIDSEMMPPPGPRGDPYSGAATAAGARGSGGREGFEDMPVAQRSALPTASRRSPSGSSSPSPRASRSIAASGGRGRGKGLRKGRSNSPVRKGGRGGGADVKPPEAPKPDVPPLPPRAAPVPGGSARNLPVLLNPEDRPPGWIGAYSPEARRERIIRFLEKRQRRVWVKTVKYGVRKSFADSRLRVKGRFVKKEDEEMLREFMLLI